MVELWGARKRAKNLAAGWRGRYVVWERDWSWCCLLIVLCEILPGCSSGGNDVRADSEGKTRITQLKQLYKAYVDRNKKGPADEAALREFGSKLTAEERASYLIGDDIDALFTSPRDKQKYVIRFNQKFEPTGPMRGVVWEAQGQDGRRYVALTNGYVEEYRDEMAQEYIK